jgi:hypothetical protein
MREKISSVNLKVCCIVFFVFVALAFVVKQTCHGYIMPAEQLIAFMADNFSKFNSLLIIQSVSEDNQRIDEEHLVYYEDAEDVFKEQLWIKSPNLFRSQLLGYDEDRGEIRDMAYRQLLIANSQEGLERLLSGMGINLHSVAFTRIDGVIAYRIGDKGLYSPKLVIEKERFLPLLLMYGLSEDYSEGPVSVWFKEYRKVGGGWYPFEITYSVEDRAKETFEIQHMEVNIPIDPSIFESSSGKTRLNEAQDTKKKSPEEKRLRKIIKAFEEKYR